MKNALTSLAIVTAILAQQSVAVAQTNTTKVVNVYNWGDYIDPGIKQSFEESTGINVVYDVFDTNETLEGKLLSGNTGYDVVVPSNQFLARHIQAGVYRKLDKTKIPNFKYLDPEFLKKLESSDPGNNYGVPYLWASTGLIYNPQKVSALIGSSEIDSWSAVFDVVTVKKLSKCGVAFLDSPDEVITSALIYLGLDPNTSKPDDFKAAENLLKKIAPYVTYFNSSKHVSDLANGNICIAIGYSGDAGMVNSRAQEARNGVQVKFTVPKEGAKLSVDMLAVPADARNTDNAEAFINYVIDPKNMAAITNYVHFPNAVADAKQFIASEILHDTAIYPDAQTMARLVVAKIQPPSVNRLQTRAWNKIKSGK
ncbi:Spermidine-binding periplasmic protein SpuE [Pseudomonas fluorescens]|uniref:Spermidine-binding periplasmic protein SpuE n=1 Tax=Pseudomonas fluorescens TaxID=294 RepID=A0A5E6S8M4_PSEFL|nr:polyamine ABC transporter substrate-binding protein [Pseudomonas fluorescens]VVM77079.1 Spermidine-binding periplasmic protein SpuE [Pseudomonas fluorescens]